MKNDATVLVRGHKKQTEGKQVVPNDWLAQATEKHITSISPGLHNNGYGYFWWLGQVEGYDVMSALGHGGQFIIILPDLELIVTASTIGGVSEQMAARQFDTLERILYSELIPSIIDQQAVH